MGIVAVAVFVTVLVEATEVFVGVRVSVGVEVRAMGTTGDTLMLRLLQAKGKIPKIGNNNKPTARR